MSSPGHTLAGWLSEYLFVDGAYVESAKDHRRWFWSAQLINFTATLVCFVWQEGGHRVVVVDREGEDQSRLRKGKLKGAWFVNTTVHAILGFLGSISAAFPLFLIQRSLVTGTLNREA
jgi:hypothetical protein